MLTSTSKQLLEAIVDEGRPIKLRFKDGSSVYMQAAVRAGKRGWACPRTCFGLVDSFTVASEQMRHICWAVTADRVLCSVTHFELEYLDLH